MAHVIRKGTRLDVGGDPLDEYIVERITRTETGYVLTLHTARQRCFPQAGIAPTIWTDTYVREQVSSGTMRIL